MRCFAEYVFLLFSICGVTCSSATACGKPGRSRKSFPIETGDEIFEEGFRVEYRCQHLPAGETYRTCEDGKWSGSIPKCPELLIATGLSVRASSPTTVRFTWKNEMKVVGFQFALRRPGDQTIWPEIYVIGVNGLGATIRRNVRTGSSDDIRLVRVTNTSPDVRYLEGLTEMTARTKNYVADCTINAEGQWVQLYSNIEGPYLCIVPDWYGLYHINETVDGCQTPDTPLNAIVESTFRSDKSLRANYSCVDGYRLSLSHGRLSPTCPDNGDWTSYDFQPCEKVLCDRYQTDLAIVSFDQPAASGSRSAIDTIGKAADCGMPGRSRKSFPINAGDREIFAEGFRVEYRCQHMAVGETYRTCEDGRWSGSIPKCPELLNVTGLSVGASSPTTVRFTWKNEMKVVGVQFAVRRPGNVTVWPEIDVDGVNGLGDTLKLNVRSGSSDDIRLVRIATISPDVRFLEERTELTIETQNYMADCTVNAEGQWVQLYTNIEEPYLCIDHDWYGLYHINETVDDCQTPDTSLHAILESTFRSKNTLTPVFSCVEGYRLKPSRQSPTCAENGDWTLYDFQPCEEISHSFDSLMVSDDKPETSDSSFPIGTKGFLECSTQRDERYAVCTHDGTWLLITAPCHTSSEDTTTEIVPTRNSPYTRDEGGDTTSEAESTGTNGNSGPYRTHKGSYTSTEAESTGTHETSGTYRRDEGSYTTTGIVPNRLSPYRRDENSYKTTEAVSTGTQGNGRPYERDEASYNSSAAVPTKAHPTSDDTSYTTANYDTRTHSSRKVDTSA